MDILLLAVVGICLLGAALCAVSFIRKQRRNAAMNDFAHQVMCAKLDDQNTDQA